MKIEMLLFTVTTNNSSDQDKQIDSLLDNMLKIDEYSYYMLGIAILMRNST